MWGRGPRCGSTGAPGRSGPSRRPIFKISAIFKHQSQKDRAPFPGLDDREFWQRVEERNKGTAGVLDRLGLPEYFAMEALVRAVLTHDPSGTPAPAQPARPAPASVEPSTEPSVAL